MNYITHLNKAFAIFCEDERLSPFHVSLYFSLFQYWNLAKFRNPISISRDEVMRASKIGSVNTYIRCIKELDKWAYIKYVPSYNPQKGSQVHLYNFNNSNDNSKNNGIDISDNKGADKTNKKATDNANEKLVIPSINNSNNINSKNNVKGHQQSQNQIISNCQPERSRRRVEQESPTLEKITIYFSEKNFPATEAEKFFNYFESNGWLVGGRSPMKNWKAAANNWVLNIQKFNNDKTIRSNNKSSQQTGNSNLRAGNLNTSTNKNYNEPL